MIVCPECASLDVAGMWEQDLKDPVWRCRACGHRWPVTPGDGVAAWVRDENRAAVKAVADVCKRRKWSTGGTKKQ